MCAFSTNFRCCACHSGLATVAWSKLLWWDRPCAFCFSALWRGNFLAVCDVRVAFNVVFIPSLFWTLYIFSAHFQIAKSFFVGAQNARPTAPWHLFFLTLHISPPHLRLHSRSLTHHVNCSVTSDATTATYCWVFLRILNGFCGAFAETGLALQQSHL